MNVCVVDYGLGNVQSVLDALHFLKYEVKCDRDANHIESADLLILPGVASFGAGIRNLIKLKQFEAIKSFFYLGKPIIGLCLGAQMLLEGSEESLAEKGFGFVKGNNLKLNSELGSVPHQGWSRISLAYNSRLFEKFDNKFFYFSHSYKLLVEKKTSIVATVTDRKEKITAIYEHENIVGLQFHPEKSGKDGLSLLHEIIEYKKRI